MRDFEWLVDRSGGVETGKVSWGPPANGGLWGDINSLDICLLFCPWLQTSEDYMAQFDISSIQHNVCLVVNGNFTY